MKPIKTKLELNTLTLCEICLGMIKEHKKAMSSPVYRYLEFEEWIEEVYNSELKRIHKEIKHEIKRELANG